MNNAEDIIADFRLTPYTEEVDRILQPHLKLLHQILHKPNEVGSYVPSLQYIRERRSGSRSIQHTGDLSPDDQARAANWFFSWVPGAGDEVHNWLGLVPIAHAHTIIIAYRHRERLKALVPDFPVGGTPEEQQVALWPAAWHYQCNRPPFPKVDVDLECLGDLEKIMFENSREAGAAGNAQWGLDAGDHQGKWDPYQTIPHQWNHGDREGDDAELYVSHLS